MLKPGQRVVTNVGPGEVISAHESVAHALEGVVPAEASMLNQWHAVRLDDGKMLVVHEADLEVAR